MKKVLSMSIVLAGMILICGCGHNIVNYSDGIGLETTINPETYTVGLNFRYGKILSVICRENTKIKMNGSGKGQAGITGTATDKSNASADGAVEITVGGQCNGYLTEICKQDKTLAEKIIDKMYQDAKDAKFTTVNAEKAETKAEK